MMKCLRIFGAYSFRLTRKHSTVMMISAILVVLTITFQLYAYRNHRHRNPQPSAGDFNYRPGAFLRHVQPNQNNSFCHFNYGLPYRLKWRTVHVSPSMELGLKSPYRIIYDAIRGTAYTNVSKYDSVTYVTQATPEFIYHVVEITRYWEGPISLAVYVPDYDLDIAMQLLRHLCHCYQGMSKVSVHLVYPTQSHPKMARDPPLTTTEPPTASNVSDDEMNRLKSDNYRKLTSKDRAEYIEKARAKKIERMMLKMPFKRSRAPRLRFGDCSGPESFSIATFRREYNQIYPINVARNAARNASRTNYFLVSDIEMLPSDGLASKFVTMVRKLMGDKKRDEGCVFAKTVFVVPLFEVESGEEIPRNKAALVEMVKNNRAMYFHQKTCSHCQRFPHMQTWLKRPQTEELQPMVMAKREYPYHRWEPLYFGTRKEPLYSESLSWEGQQDKMTQMLELCLQDYRMVVLDGGFLCHAAARGKSRHKKAMNMNLQHYMKIIAAMKLKYPDNPNCKVDYGCKHCRSCNSSGS